jgi:hypothetical protein
MGRLAEEQGIKRCCPDRSLPRSAASGDRNNTFDRWSVRLPVDNRSQQRRADTPVACCVATDGRRLAIQPRYFTLPRSRVVSRELDTHADAEPGEIDELPGGSDQPQPLHDTAIQIDEFFFKEPRKINHRRRYSEVSGPIEERSQLPPHCRLLAGYVTSELIFVEQPRDRCEKSWQLAREGRILRGGFRKHPQLLADEIVDGVLGAEAPPDPACAALLDQIFSKRMMGQYTRGGSSRQSSYAS